MLGGCRAIIVIALLASSSCVPASSSQLEPQPGPDKQGAGFVQGALTGAGSGAIYGAQVSAGSGPGALVGAGMGALWGMGSGLGLDLVEEGTLKQQKELQCARNKAWVQEVLAEHYARRLELHPNRDIFPADLFFQRDSFKLKGNGQLLARELAVLTKQRMPWSRIVIASYVTARSAESTYAEFISRKRAEELATEFIHQGVEPRRVLVQPRTLSGPILIDPDDNPERYNQAIEILALDY